LAIENGRKADHATLQLDLIIVTWCLNHTAGIPLARAWCSSRRVQVTEKYLGRHDRSIEFGGKCQQILVTSHQKVCPTNRRQFDKHLVLDIAASG
jgi:hypothetical protein